MVGWIENELHVNDEWDHVKGVFVSCWENATICKKGMEEGKKWPGELQTRFTSLMNVCLSWPPLAERAPLMRCLTKQRFACHEASGY